MQESASEKGTSKQWQWQETGRDCKDCLPHTHATAIACRLREIMLPKGYSPLGSEGELPSPLLDFQCWIIVDDNCEGYRIGSFFIGGGLGWFFIDFL